MCYIEPTNEQRNCEKESAKFIFKITNFSWPKNDCKILKRKECFWRRKVIQYGLLLLFQIILFQIYFFNISNTMSYLKSYDIILTSRCIVVHLSSNYSFLPQMLKLFKAMYYSNHRNWKRFALQNCRDFPYSIKLQTSEILQRYFCTWNWKQITINDLWRSYRFVFGNPSSFSIFTNYSSLFDWLSHFVCFKYIRYSVKIRNLR